MAKVAQLTHPERSYSQDSVDGIRKRVCKACDRCRMKKSKCDGSSPCNRCKVDNAICVFGERKKSHDKVYPKGYVEMLEQQQSQLVSALREMYSKLVDVDAWSGPALSETNGHPLTHDILAALNLIETKQDGSGEPEVFEDDCSVLQSKLISGGAGLVHRRGSISSESEHSHHGRAMPTYSPKPSRDKVFRDSFSLESTVTTPSSRGAPPAKRPKSISTDSPLSSTPLGSTPVQQQAKLGSDPMQLNKDWPNTTEPATVMRSQSALQGSTVTSSLTSFDTTMYGGVMFDSPATDYDASFGSGFGSMPINTFTQQGFDSYSVSVQNEFGPGCDPMDFDFNPFVVEATV